MLKIFKFFPMRTSLLDDFAFYDGRQKVLQERKTRQQYQQQRHQVFIVVLNICTFFWRASLLFLVKRIS
jgi:hypothetical protein